MKRPDMTVADGALDIHVELRGSRVWISTQERKAIGTDAVQPLAQAEVRLSDFVQALRKLMAEGWQP